MERNILAISGGGFSEQEQAYIDEYLLKIANKQRPLKIAFVATASMDAPTYIEKFYEAFKTEETCHIPISDFSLEYIQEFVNSIDVVYVGGGNTQYMLHVWKETNFDKVLKKAYQNGVILAGVSAGAMCWFDVCYSENNKDQYEEFRGLGLLKGAFCPHYNDERRRTLFDQWSREQKDLQVHKLKDNENLHFRNEQLIAKIIS